MKTHFPPVVSPPSLAADIFIWPHCRQWCSLLSSALAMLCALIAKIRHKWTAELDTIPILSKDYSRRQCGSGSHASASRKMLRSVVITDTSPCGTPLLIRHLALDECSQSLVGRNITSWSNIHQLDGSYIPFPGPTGSRIKVPLLESHFQIYFHTCFFHVLGHITLVQGATGTETSTTCADVKHLIDPIYSHVCGHSSHKDMQLLLSRKGF